jgi:hypothetical protein
MGISINVLCTSIYYNLIDPQGPFQPRHSITRVWNSITAPDPVIRPCPGGGDFLKNLFFVFHQAEGELLLETGGTEVRHVDWHMGQVVGGFLSWFAQGFICQVRHRLSGQFHKIGQASRRAFFILREPSGNASLFLGRRLLRAEAFGAWSAECFANKCKAVLASLPVKA